ncbi:MAG: T9SS type A sorting domain-containing protein, partial [Bacteroidia bacterium]|nr:T9SS type A sorting domain-containing protein [Bacteroidia bacterium]
DSILLGGSWQTEAGDYSDVLQSVYGCDSTVVTNLIVNPVFVISSVVGICEGDSVEINGNYYYAAGTYTDILATTLGCDSIVVSDVIVNPVFQVTNDVQICTGQTYFAGGAYQTASGIYADVYPSVLGCDSVISTNLTVTDSIINIIDIAICEGDSVFAQGAYQFTAGTYYDFLTAQGGCDSTVVTNLIVNPVYVISSAVEICDGDSVYLGGSWQTTSGDYTDVLTSQTGCDSTIVTSLTINTVPVISSEAEICLGENYTLPDGTVIDSAGIYTSTLSTILGCDSIIVTTLTVNDYPVVELGADDSLCFDTNDSLVLDAGLTGSSYLWTGGYTSQTLTVGAQNLGLGTHVIYVTVSNGDCETVDSVIMVVDICDAIAQVNNETVISIFPNPVSDKVYVKGEGITRITVYDMLGQVLLVNETTYETNSIPMNRLSDGHYLLKVETVKGIINKVITLKR